MNNYDWVVTVAIGSMCGSTILIRDVLVAEGLIAIAVLILVQAILTKLAAKYRIIRRCVHVDSTLLHFRGAFLEDNLIAERVSKAEIYSADSLAGAGSLEDVAAVMIESSGDLAVVKASPDASLVLIPQ